MVYCRDFQKIVLDLHIPHDGCRTGANTDSLHIFDYLVRFDHYFSGCYHYSVRLHSFGRLLGNFVSSLNLGGSQPLHGFLPHILHTKMIFHFSCYMGNISLCVLHVLGKCYRIISSKQTERPVDLCLVDRYL